MWKQQHFYRVLLFGYCQLVKLAGNACHPNTKEATKDNKDLRKKLYLDVQLIFVGADVDERHVGRGAVAVVVADRKVSARNVVAAEEIDLGQLSVDQPPGVNDGALEGVAPQDRVLLGLADDAVRDNGLDLEGSDVISEPLGPFLCYLNRLFSD